MRKHPVKLTDEQRQQLHKLIRSGQAPARKLTHARILLKADAGELDTKTSKALDVSIATIWRVRKRFGQEGFDSALAHKHPRQLKPPRLDGRAVARLFTLACSEPPQGRARWTLQLLADQLVQLELVSHVCRETVRKTLKKGALRLTAGCSGASHPSTTRPLSAPWRTCWTSTSSPTTQSVPWSASMSGPVL